MSNIVPMSHYTQNVPGTKRFPVPGVFRGAGFGWRMQTFVAGEETSSVSEVMERLQYQQNFNAIFFGLL